jgi:DNA-binding GntR family transcriptional regulator
VDDYVKIANAVRAQIQDGTLKPGDACPPDGPCARCEAANRG